jgi:2-keto-3-deoxy-L-rhamnonate aldolase RhmA
MGAHHGATPLEQYIADQHAEPPVLVGQIETGSTDDPLSLLASAPLDALFIGTTDLSVSLGHPGKADHPAMVERIAAVVSACRHNELPVGAFAASPEALMDLRGRGVSFAALGADLGMLAVAMRRNARAAKELIGGAS